VTEVDATTILVVVASVGSMLLIIGELAQEMGRSQVRWVWTAAAIGPLATPLLYTVAATSALRKMMKGPRRWSLRAM
jgi:hypothetical protein